MELKVSIPYRQATGKCLEIILSYSYLFQFLIGRLQASVGHKNEKLLSGFQFLIGRLQALFGYLDLVDVLSFNSL